jgi:hypothetical protein
MGVHYSAAPISMYSVGCARHWRRQVFGATIASSTRRRLTMPRFWNAALLCAALVAPIAIAPTTLRADDQKTDQKNARTYHDKNHNDDHEWNGQEDKAYRIYVKQNHHKYRDFSKANESDQQAYWDWRHEHSDALLKIDIK